MELPNIIFKLSEKKLVKLKKIWFVEGGGFTPLDPPPKGNVFQKIEELVGSTSKVLH